MLVREAPEGCLDRNIGALLIRMGFWGRAHYTVVIIRNPKKNGIGNSLGPYSTPLSGRHRSFDTCEVPQSVNSA